MIEWETEDTRVMKIKNKKKRDIEVMEFNIEAKDAKVVNHSKILK